MDRAKFFASLRARASGVFGTSLSQGQVSGTEAILGEAQRRGTRTNDLAYMLATVYLETAHTMQPIKEIGGEAYFTKMYDIKGSRPAKARELGNLTPGDGAKYAGRGFVQLTGKANYEKARARLGVDFVRYPERVMELPLATAILFTGMAEGWFTTKDLDDFIDDKDEDDAEDRREYKGARKIINGTDKADMIAGYALAFEKALRDAGYVAQAPKPRPVPQAQTSKSNNLPIGEPVIVYGDPSKPVPPVNRVPEPVPAGKQGIIGLILAALATGAYAAWEWIAALPCNVTGWWC